MSFVRRFAVWRDEAEAWRYFHALFWCFEERERGGGGGGGGAEERALGESKDDRAMV